MLALSGAEGHMTRELHSGAVKDRPGEDLTPSTCGAVAGDAQGGSWGHVEPLWGFISTRAAQGAGVSSPGRQLVSHSSRRECIQQGGEACALIWRAAGPRRGRAEAQLLPGIRPDKQARSRKLEALQLHQRREEAVQTFLCWG